MEESVKEGISDGHYQDSSELKPRIHGRKHQYLTHPRGLLLVTTRKIQILEKNHLHFGTLKQNSSPPRNLTSIASGEPFTK